MTENQQRPNRIAKLHATGAGAYEVTIEDIELSDKSMEEFINKVLAFSR